MPRVKRTRCRFCAAFFSPNRKVGARQYACSKAECQARRQQANHRAWVSEHPDCYRGRAGKHARYRAEVAAGRRVPRRRPKPADGDQREQEAILTQAVLQQPVNPILLGGSEQEEILAQGRLLQALIVTLPAPSLPVEQEEMERRRSAWQDLVRRLMEGAPRRPPTREQRDLRPRSAGRGARRERRRYVRTA